MSIATLVHTFLERVSADPATTADLLAPNVVWELNGQVQTTSAVDFVERQLADQATGSDSTEVETTVVGDGSAAVLGWITFEPHEGEGMTMRFAEVLTVVDDRITRIGDVMVRV